MAKRQACYNNALNTCGIYELRSFKTDTSIAYDNNVYTITSTYHDNTFKIYTIYLNLSTDLKSLAEYYIT